MAEDTTVSTFEALCARLAAIESASADTECTALVADLLDDSGPALATVARFVQGRVFPAWDSTTLDIGPRLCYAAIARAAGPNVTADDVEARVTETGDVGAAAASFEFGGQQGLGAFTDGATSSPLTVEAVDEELRAVAAATGPGSEERKLDRLFGLFNRCSAAEAKYLSRLVLAEMRIGVGAGTVRDAVAEAFEVPVERVERALQVSNDYGRVARVARDVGESGLAELRLEVGRPVQAMLAQAGTAEEALDAWERVAVETKYDGARVQVHVGGDDTDAGNVGDTGGDGGVRVFSRNMEDVTDALPEIVEAVEAHVDGPAILDGEALAVDEAGEPLAFQAVLRRFRRKHDVDRVREEVRLELRVFDCLHAGGDDLLDSPLTDRRDRLTSLVGPDDAEPSDADGAADPLVASLTLTDDADAVAAHERRALEAGHEGVMLKDPDSTYSPGSRGKHWLKRKPDVETLDLVVTGAEWGEGRRADHFGTFLLSARTDSGYAEIGKVATGITDETLTELTELLEPHVVSESGKEIDVAPAVVFEVGYEEIQSSPTYGSGYALRFPRFVAVREKAPADADTVSTVRRLAAAAANDGR